jgi:hypothetical protein
VLTAVILLVVGALWTFPRARRIVSTSVRCPLLGRPVAADLEWDEWKARFVDVAWCSALGGCARGTCNRRCLGATAPAAIRRAT